MQRWGMMKYRKKPVIVEAMQWFPLIRINGVDIHTVNIAGHEVEGATIKTLEVVMQIRPGDWVITGVEGEIYSCKDSIFKATYELVE